MMHPQSPTFRDVEIMSAYLDKQLPAEDVSRLEKKLENDAVLQGILADLKYSRSILGALPLRRAPRNFTLTPKMAGVLPPAPRTLPVFRFASALAAILFIFAFSANLAQPAWSYLKTSLPAPYAEGRGGGPMPLAAEAPAAPVPEAVLSVTATPEIPMAKSAPTEAAAVEAAPFAAVPDISSQAAPSLSTMNNGSQPVPNETPVQYQLPVPAVLLYLLLGLITFTAAAAMILQVLSRNKWRKANGITTGSIDYRLAALIVIFIILMSILFGVVYYVSANPIYLPAADVNNLAYAGPSGTDSQSQAPGPALNGEKGPASGGDKGGNSPAADTQGFTLSPEIGYNFTVMDGMNQLTAIDFPPSFAKSNLLITYIPGLSNITSEIPFNVNRAFTLLPEDKNLEFSTPFTFTFDYSEDWASTIDENTIVLYWWNGTTWQDANTTCDPVIEYFRHPESNRLSISACKMGSFILIAP